MQHDVTIELEIHDINEYDNRTKMKAITTRVQLQKVVTNVSKETFPDIKEWNITMKWNDIDLTSRLLNQLNSKIPVVVTMNNMTEAEKNNITSNELFLKKLKETINKDEILSGLWPGFKVPNISKTMARPTKGTLNSNYYSIFMMSLLFFQECYR